MLRRFSVFSLALLLCLSLFPARALADVGNASVLWSGSIDDGARFGAFVKGGTRFDAAAASLGYDSSRFSDEVKSKLADSHYGGMFYTFANAFSPVSSPIEIPSWVPAFVTTSSVIADLLNNISGENYPHWSVAVTYSVYDLALRDLLVVLSGGSGGGSGGGDSGGGEPMDGTYTVEFTPAMVYKSRVYGSPDGYDVSLMTHKVTFSIDSSYDSYNSTLLGNLRRSQYIIFTYLMGTGNTSTQFYIFPSNSNSFSVTGGGSRRFKISCNPIDNKGFTPNTRSTHNCAASGNVDVYANPSTYTVFSSNSAENWNLWVCVVPTSEFFGSPEPDPPAGVWPEPVTPAAPVAPELPEPAEPVVETPVSPSVSAPSWPDITINIEPDPIPGTTPSGLDYTELLTRINDNLISIDSFSRAINSNLNSLRSDLLAEFNGVIDSLRNVYNYLLTIDSVLETHCTHLRNKMEESAVFIANYMRTLIKWLADQLDYDDLTNVEAPDNSLLTTINEKLGGGTYEPNPIKDEQGYYQWLDDLWDRFLLGDNWQSSMGSISGSFSELKTRFPFSVPWDIVALFRLFVHDPVTPVFDLPLYFSPDGSTPVHVDLSPWDSVASLVRPMIFVIFALKLALLSRDLLGGLGADKGGL